MRRAGPDRALRRAVAGLSGFHPDDLAIILDALEPAEKDEVDRLLAELSGRPPLRGPDDEAAQPELSWTYQGVSPWLRARMDEVETGRAHADFFLVTEAARSALIAAAEPFRAPRGAPRAGCLLGRLWVVLAGARP